MNKFYLLRVMRILILFMLVGFMHVSAKSTAQQITFRGNNVPFVKALDVIRQQGGYEVAADRSLLKGAKSVTVSVRNISVEEFLTIILRDQSLKAKIEDKTIILSRKPDLKRVSVAEAKASSVLQQSIIVRVLDTLSNPLSGASITNKMDKLKGMTNDQGMAIIKVNKGDILEISFLGFQTRQVTIKDDVPMVTVKLKLSTNELDEAIVVGYGTTTKRFNTGNVVTIKSEEIERQPVMNPLIALQGRTPGVQVQMLSGYSSSPIKVEIRGKNSLNPNSLTEPLYIIDGIPQTTLSPLGNNSFNAAPGVSGGLIQDGTSATGGQSILFNINPNDIESINVLKDGDATAIYGSRAANGVILITTKKGAPGKTLLKVDLTQGMTMIPRYPRVLDLQQYLIMRREAFKNDGITPTISNAPDLIAWNTTSRSTDWVREMVGSGHHTDVSASLTGGDAKTNFRLSGSYTDRVDLNTPSGGNTRGTGSFRIAHESTNKKLAVDVLASYTYSKVDAVSAMDVTMTPPNAPPIYDNDGHLNFSEWEVTKDIIYPFSNLLRPNLQSTQSLNSSVSVQYTLLKGLTVSGSGRLSSNNNSNDNFTPIASQNPSIKPTGNVRFGTTKVNNIAFEPEIRYNTILGKGSLNMFIGASVQSANSKALRINANGYTNDGLLKSVNHAAIITNTDGYSEYKYAAVFGRINYNWDSKYILNVNARRDGSSRFAPGKQFGNFGSVGVAWIASEEKWLKSVMPDWFTFVKFRGSYAITGSDAIGDYEYLPRYNINNGSGTSPQYDGIQPYMPVIPVNQQYQWESLKSVESALALGFIEDRINLDVSWYQKRSGNQLTQIPTPVYTGFPRVTANWTATVQNRGLEVSLSGQLIRHRDFQLSTSFNISQNSNKLIAYPGLDQSPYSTRYKIGQSLNTQYYLNLIGVNPLTGAYAFEDYNKDGRISTEPNVFPGTGSDDRYIAFNMDPKFQGGWGSDIRWKNYGLSFNFYFINQLGPHPIYQISPGGMKNFILPQELIENHWQKPGDDVKYARYSTMGTRYPVSPIDASFIRLQNVAFSYDLSKKIAHKIGMENARFSINAQNLLTITAYSNDPEIQGLGGVFNPQPRVVVGVLSFTF